MPSDCCGFCNTSITRSSPGIKCDGQCRSTYHLKCAKLPPSFSELTPDSGVTWICSRCKAASDASPSLIKELLTKVEGIHKDMRELKSNKADVFKSINFYGEKFDEFNQQMETIKNIIKNFEQLKSELTSIRNEYNSLRHEFVSLSQRSRLNNIEIVGVPESKNEDLLSVVKRIGDTVGVIVLDTDIDNEHRVNRFSTSNSNKLPKNIIMKFTSRIKKDLLVQAFRTERRNGLPCKDINIPGEATVYVNEHLSPYYKLLLKKTKHLCKRLSFKYCWVKDGKILIKKSDNSRTLWIYHEDKLSTLR